MEQIKNIIGDVLKNLEKRQQNTKEEIEDLWLRCVKKTIAKHTRISFLKKGKLYINVENPAWLYELRIKKEALFKRISKLSKNKIKDISFRVGDIDDSG